jgi:hypothetical protein
MTIEVHKPELEALIIERLKPTRVTMPVRDITV